jgi:phytoene desaturase
MADVAVIGAGVGGLATAIHLGTAGHHVTVIERRPEVGGKLGQHSRDGFTFETGPSLLTMPFVFDELLGSVQGAVRLDPVCAYRFADRSGFAGFTTRGSLPATVASVAALAPGSEAAWRAFHAHGRDVWEVSARTFFAGPIESPMALARRLRSPRDLAAIDPGVTLATRARRSFTDPRLRQWAGRYATYTGSSPYRAPATLACIPYLEQEYGAWAVAGGLGRLATQLGAAATAAGATIRCGASVTAIRVEGDRVRGVEVDGDLIGADIVVSDADATSLYTDLLPDRRRLRRARRAGLSSSGFVVLAAVDGPTPGIAHHNVAFSSDYRREFHQIFDRGEPADEPTVYACVSSMTDASVAPPGAENWSILVNVPAGPVTWDPDRYRERVFDVLAARGWDIRPRVRWTEVLTPADLEARFVAPGGAIYGTSSNGRRAAFLRAANRGPVRGLYLVGGSAHPGGGLPIVAMGAAIVAGMIQADGW